MIEEADELLTRFHGNMLYFGDDLVLASPRRARELTEALGALKRPVEYSVSCRFDVLSRMDDDLLRQMKQTGCRIMGLGIESGSQRILDVMHKRITVDQIVTGLKRLKDAGILPTVSIMVGQLSETSEDVERSLALMIESVRYNKNIQYAFTIATPFPGSELYDIALQKGVLEDHYDFYRRLDPIKPMGKVTVNLSRMSDGEIEASKEWLLTTFRQEKRRAVGRKVQIVELLRRSAAWMDRRGRRLAASLPNKAMAKIVLAPYEWAYDAVQTLLDKWRLWLLGIGRVERP
jgi:radical SAM superfamily enzyme YgiQ (UPF0313 family)